MSLKQYVTSLAKRPFETRTFDMDFNNFTEIQAGDTLASISGTDTHGTALGVAATLLTGPGSPALSLGTPAIRGTTVRLVIWGGGPRDEYALTFTALTTGGATLEAAGVLNVLDR